MSTKSRDFTPILRTRSTNSGYSAINDELLRFCTDQRITVTRSRPGNKNHDAQVEQKKRSLVRELVGYLRYESDEELELLNKIRELDCVFINYLLPQQQRLQKTRHGAKVSKVLDQPATT